MNPSSAVPLDALTGALGRFHFVPADSAHYDTGVPAAATLLRTLPERIVELAARGLPSRDGDDGRPLFDYADLMNVGRFCGSGLTTPEMNPTYLMRFVTGPSSGWLDPRDWLLKVKLPEKEPGRFLLRVPELTAPGITPLAADGIRWPAGNPEFDTDSYQAAIRVTGALDQVAHEGAREVYRQMLADLDSGRVTYQVVGEPLRLDHHRAWELGMADCMVVSRVIADRFRDLGLTARARRGYLLGLVGSEHAWCEVHEDGRWKAVDVGFAHIPLGLTLKQRPPQAAEFVAACFGTRFNRLVPCVAEDAASLIHDKVADRPRSMIAVVSATNWKES
jgi:hypothetical protein